MKSLPQRIPSLDGLRTVSIALVIVGHVFHTIGLGGAGNLGNLGVRIFFVISGFLITGLLVREVERTSTINLLKFYYRRTLRIFPPYYFFLAAMLFAALLGIIDVPGLSLFFASVYATDYINPASWYLGHTWSLAVEEQFYLLLPGVLLLVGLRRAKLLLLLIIAALPVLRIVDYHVSGADQFWVLKGFHANMDALAVGCILTLMRSAFHANGLYKRFLGSRLLMVLLPILILAANFQYDHPHIFYGLSITVMNVSIALCLDWVVTNHGSLCGRVLNFRPMVTLGAMSYSIYLWQQPFFNPEQHGLLTQFPFNFIGLAVTTAISYYLVERYSLKLRQRWETRLFDRKAIANADRLEYAGTAG